MPASALVRTTEMRQNFEYARAAESHYRNPGRNPVNDARLRKLDEDDQDAETHGRDH